MATPIDAFINLPVLNEAENIERVLGGIRQHLDGFNYTVCVIDDGSGDRTVALVQAAARESGSHVQLLHRRKETRGCQRGAALLHGLRWGLLHTSHQVFVEMDGDSSHRPEELLEGLERVASGEFDIVVASKYLSGSRTLNRPIGRRLVSAICNAGVRAFVSPALSDYSNGYRFYTRRAAEIVAAHDIRHGSPIYLTEAMAIWLRHGMRVGEFPSTYVGRNEGLSKVHWIDMVKGVVAVFDVALRFHVTGFGLRKTDEPVRSMGRS